MADCRQWACCSVPGPAVFVQLLAEEAEPGREHGVLAVLDQRRADIAHQFFDGVFARGAIAAEQPERIGDDFLGFLGDRDLGGSRRPGMARGGQVDIVSGKFVFSCTEAYRVKNGKLGDPIKGATLIGDGPTALTKIIGIGNDMALDEGIGVCGKGGQSVPAGVGQPTTLVRALTVGGTAG